MKFKLGLASVSPPARPQPDQVRTMSVDALLHANTGARSGNRANRVEAHSRAPDETLQGR